MHRVLPASLLPLVLALACGGSPESAGGPGNAGTPIESHTRPVEGAAGQAPAALAENGGAPALEGSAGSDATDETGAGAGGAAPEPIDAGGAGGGGDEPEGYCGDGVQQGLEYCDDGNAVRGDGCNPDCGISGRSIDNGIEVRAYAQSLEGAVIIGDTLYGVGTSNESTDEAAKSDKLFVSVDLTSGVLAPASLVSGTAGKNDSLQRITTDGTALYTGGKVQGADFGDALVEKRTLAGAVQWTRTLTGNGSGEDALTGLAVVGSQLQAVGYALNAGTNIDMLFSRLSRTNSKAPLTSFVTSSGSHYDNADDIAPLGTGAVVAGKIWSDQYSARIVWLRRVDAEMNTLWTTTFVDYATVTRVKTAPDGRIAIVGGGGNPLSGDSWVAVYDADGAYLWSKYFEHLGDDYATSVAFDPENGDLVVCGAIEDHNWNVYVQRLSPEGDERWFTTFDGSGYDDRAEDVLIGEDGTIWAVGSWGSGGGDSEYWIGKFAP